ncbi:hypothetical protein Tco_0749754 [Tanacetum coccineum]|uniref:Uncharacterized protein n=1 Tax=Tanacetum coccineum TaxID=301880 RepID=A0ABQ4Z2W9_9ASTR
MWVNSYSHFIKPVSCTSLWVTSDKATPLLLPQIEKDAGAGGRKKGIIKATIFYQTRPKPVVKKENLIPHFADSNYADTTGSASVDPGFGSVDPGSTSADPRSTATNDPRSTASDVHTFTGLLQSVEQQETDIQEKDEKQSQKQQNQAEWKRQSQIEAKVSQSQKVNPDKVKSQPSEENTT